VCVCVCVYLSVCVSHSIFPDKDHPWAAGKWKMTGLQDLSQEDGGDEVLNKPQPDAWHPQAPAPVTQLSEAQPTDGWPLGSRFFHGEVEDSRKELGMRGREGEMPASSAFLFPFNEI
jgi:hypothetical protein